MKAKIDLLSQILREMEAEIGSRDLNILILKALINSIKSLQVKSPDEFYEKYHNLAKVIASTEPKFGVLNYHFVDLLLFIKKSVCTEKECRENWRKLVIKKIEEIIKESEKQNRELIKNAEQIDVEGKTILIHDHSHTVQDVLVHYKNMGKHFRVVIAEQDYEKTHDNIERLHNADIAFQVIPSYMLSHVHDQIDLVFFGALTLKNTMNFVMAPGTHGIISEFHMIRKPIYMFMNTRKYSLWKSVKKVGVFMHKHEREHFSKPIKYERIKYSHDRVPHEVFERTVTNEGMFSPAQLKKNFEAKMKNYSLDKNIKIDD